MDAPVGQTGEPQSVRFLSARLGLAVAALLIVSGLYALFLWTLPPPAVSVVLTAKTESLAYRVINSDMAAIHISGMKGASLDGLISGCVDAVLTPTVGTRVEYRRGNADQFSITLDPAEGNAVAAYLHNGNSAKNRSVSGSLVFSIAKACGETTPIRLPIWGPTEFGEVMHPPDASGEMAPGLLTQGTLSIYGRAHERLLGLKFPALVYLVTSFDLPAGSVLSNKGNDGKLGESPWTGVARVIDDESGFDIAASTDARTVSVTSAGVSDGAQAGQRIELGDYSQFMNDPNVIQIQVLGGIFLFLLQGLSGISGLVNQHFSRRR
jgi:hypothetical protein